MFLRKFRKSLCDVNVSAGEDGSAPRGRAACAPDLESLEPRVLLSGTQYMVDTAADIVADDGLISLREALMAANANAAVCDAPAGSAAEADDIIFAPELAGAVLTLTQGELAVTDDVSITGFSDAHVTLDAAGASRIFYINTFNSINVNLTSLDICGGWSEDDGGAIWCIPYAKLHLSDCVMYDNHADGYGGAIYQTYFVVAVGTTAEDCTFSGNSSGNRGGAIHAYRVDLARCVFEQNTAALYGGAIYCGKTNIDLTALFDNNVTEEEDSYGGGIFCNTYATVMNSIFENNASPYFAGGLFLYDGGAVLATEFRGNTAKLGAAMAAWGDTEIYLCRFEANHGKWRGGAVFAESEIEVYIGASLFNANICDEDGGAVYIAHGSTLCLYDSMLIHNTAGWYGGAVGSGIKHFGTDGGAVYLYHCTIADNDAFRGGGGVYHYDGEGVRVFNSVVAGNTSSGSGADILIDDETGVQQCYYSLIGDGSTTLLSDGVNGVQLGSTVAPLDSGLSWVGIEYDFLGLLPGPDSPLVNAGDVNFTEQLELLWDYFEQERLADSAVDIGAAEHRDAGQAYVTLDLFSTVIRPSDAFPVYFQLLAPRAATASLYIDRDDALNGNEGYLFVDLPVEQLNGGYDWNNLLLDDGDYTLGIVVSGGGLTETLSDRVTVTIRHARQVHYVVDSLADVVALDGKITLREALEAAETNQPVGDAPAGRADELDLITFAASLAGGTISLTGGELTIGGKVAIRAGEAGRITLDAGGAGRVLDIAADGLVVLEGLTLTGGYATTPGAGIRNAGRAYLTSVTLCGNALSTSSSRLSGGAIYNTGDLKLSNSVVVGNFAPFSGGGIYSSGSLEMINCTVTANFARGAGGLYATGAVTLTNSIIAGNGTTGLSDVSLVGGAEVSHCLLGVGPANLELDATNIFGDTSSSVDPGFVRMPSPGDDGVWGGDDDDFGDLRLRLSSACVDAADSARAGSAVGLGLSLDWRGAARLAGAAVDMGACECQAFAGDLTGDEKVDVADFVILKQNYNRVDALAWQGDFNSDGVVDVLDFVVLKQNYNKSYDPTAASAVGAADSANASVPAAVAAVAGVDAENAPAAPGDPLAQLSWRAPLAMHPARPSLLPAPWLSRRA